MSSIPDKVLRKVALLTGRQQRLFPQAVIQKLKAAELLRRPDVDRELPAASRIKAWAEKLHFDPRPQPVHQRQIRLLQKIHGGHGVVAMSADLL